MWMAEEVAGDAMAGYALSHAYNSAENKVLLKQSQHKSTALLLTALSLLAPVY
jgi:hypothetical protein